MRARSTRCLRLSSQSENEHLAASKTLAGTQGRLMHCATGSARMGCLWKRAHGSSRPFLCSPRPLSADSGELGRYLYGCSCCRACGARTRSPRSARRSPCERRSGPLVIACYHTVVTPSNAPTASIASATTPSTRPGSTVSIASAETPSTRPRQNTLATDYSFQSTPSMNVP